MDRQPRSTASVYVTSSLCLIALIIVVITLTMRFNTAKDGRREARNAAVHDATAERIDTLEASVTTCLQELAELRESINGNDAHDDEPIGQCLEDDDGRTERNLVWQAMNAGPKTRLDSSPEARIGNLIREFLDPKSPPQVSPCSAPVVGVEG